MVNVFFLNHGDNFGPVHPVTKLKYLCQLSLFNETDMFARFGSILFRANTPVFISQTFWATVYYLEIRYSFAESLKLGL